LVFGGGGDEVSVADLDIVVVALETILLLLHPADTVLAEEH